MSTNTPRRQVVLRFRGPDSQPSLSPDLDARQTEALQAAAERMGLPRLSDPQLSALLAAVRLRDDIPAELYAASAAVIGLIYDSLDD